MKTGYVVIDGENSVVYGKTPENAWQNYRNEFDNSTMEDVTFINLETGKQFEGTPNGIKLTPIYENK